MWRGTCRALACSLHFGLVQVDHDFGIRVRAVVVGRHLHRCRFLSYCKEILRQRWSPSGFVFSDSEPGSGRVWIRGNVTIFRGRIWSSELSIYSNRNIPMRNNERGKELRELRTRVRGKRLELEERVLEELNTKFPLCCNCTKEKTTARSQDQERISTY